MVYLVGLSMTTFYQATRVMRQMGHSQGVPPDGPIFASVPITSSAATAIKAGWARSFHSVKPVGESRREEAYDLWLAPIVWPFEKKRRVALLTEIEGDIIPVTQEDTKLLKDSEDSVDVNPKRKKRTK